MPLKALRTADHGLAAVEMAIVAGIVGLGIVSALVATKGSLNKAYGCITTAVGTEGAGSGCGGGTAVAIPSDPVLAAAQARLPAGARVNGVAANPLTGADYGADVRTGGTTRIYVADTSQGVLYQTTILSSGPNYYEIKAGEDYNGNPLFDTPPGQTVYAVRNTNGSYSFFNVTKP